MNNNKGALESPNNFNNGQFQQHKYNDFDAEIKAVRVYLSRHTATASMVEAATGIHHKNICRYKRELEKMNLLRVVRIGICKRTGFSAQYLTTNPQLIAKLRNGGSDVCL